MLTLTLTHHSLDEFSAHFALPISKHGPEPTYALRIGGVRGSVLCVCYICVRVRMYTCVHTYAHIYRHGVVYMYTSHVALHGITHSSIIHTLCTYPCYAATALC
jgi:hypothetical protein